MLSSPHILRPADSWLVPPSAAAGSLSVRKLVAFTLLVTAFSAHSALGSPAIGTLPGDPNACPAVIVAETGTPAPGGGTLEALTLNVADINALGALVFVDRIAGDDRDRAVVVADGESIQVIARGCSGGGSSGLGCGDATPIGGTFADFYGGTAPPPVINDAGDVAFAAEVFGASSPRGLFLYRASSGEIQKIAAAGDLSPQGGTFGGLGPPSLNNHGDVTFAAWDTGPPFAIVQAYLLRWRNGRLERIIGPGDPLPDGGTVEQLAVSTTQLPDGSPLLLSPRPFLEDDGRILISVKQGGGFGILAIAEAGDSWIMRDGDPDPGGGIFALIGDAVFRGGRYAFYSDSLMGGFLLGTPGNWQSAVPPVITIDGDPVISRPIIHANRPILDDAGQFTFVVSAVVGGLEEDRLVRWNEPQGIFSLAKFGDPAPGGGIFLDFRNFNSVNPLGDAAIAARIQRSTGVVQAFMRLENCVAGEIFADGFEDGTLDAWSQVVP